MPETHSISLLVATLLDGTLQTTKSPPESRKTSLFVFPTISTNMPFFLDQCLPSNMKRKKQAQWIITFTAVYSEQSDSVVVEKDFSKFLQKKGNAPSGSSTNSWLSLSSVDNTFYNCCRVSRCMKDISENLLLCVCEWVLCSTCYLVSVQWLAADDNTSWWQIQNV